MRFLDLVENELSDFVRATIELEKAKEEYYSKNYERYDFNYDGRNHIHRLEQTQAALAKALENQICNKDEE